MNTINSLFVPEHIAVKMKHLGFAEPCLATWQIQDGYSRLVLNGDDCGCGNVIVAPAPLFEQCFRWLRTFRKVYIVIDNALDNGETILWFCQGFKTFSNNYIDVHIRFKEKNKYYPTYEEACLDGVNYILDNYIKRS